MAQFNVAVGAPTRQSGFPSARGDNFGNLAVALAGGKYKDTVLQGNSYHAANQTATTIGTALTATAVTCSLYNPTGSGKNLVIMWWSFAMTSVTVTAGAIVLATNNSNVAAIPATNTALTNYNNLNGQSGAGSGVAYGATTLPTTPIAGLSLAGVQTGVGFPVIGGDIDGLLIVTPNTAVTIQGVTVSALGLSSVYWDEVPV